MATVLGLRDLYSIFTWSMFFFFSFSAGTSMEIMQQSMEFREMLLKPQHCGHDKSYQCCHGILGVRCFLYVHCFYICHCLLLAYKMFNWINQLVQLNLFSLTRTSPMSFLLSKAQYAPDDWWSGEARTHSMAAGSNPGYCLGPCVFLYLERS